MIRHGSWRVPGRTRGESKVRYRDRLNADIDRFRIYDSDRFSPMARGEFRERIKQLEKAVRALLEPGAGSR